MRWVHRRGNHVVLAGFLAALWLSAPHASHAQEEILLQPAPPLAVPAPAVPSTPVPPTLPPVVNQAPGEASGTAAGAPGGTGYTSVFEEGTQLNPANPPESELPWWRRVPVVMKLPLPGSFIIPPTGPGYYSLFDVITDNFREAPPKYPYPRFSIMTFSFFDADFRYLDDPNNQETDFFDPLKRIHLGENFLFTTGGEFRYRHANEIDSRLTGKDNTYDLTRTRVWGDLWFRDVFRIFAEGIAADTFNQDLPPLITDRNHGDFLNLFADLKLLELYDHPVYFRFGRQELLYGSQRLISPLDWANDRRTFQGAKMFYRGDKFDVDLFCVQPIIPSANRFDSVDNEQVFSGFWTTYRPKAGQNMDFYFLNLDQTRPVALGRNNVPGPFNVSTLGSRYVGNSNNWLWDLEGMLQFGSWAHQGTLAKAFTTGLGYHFKDLPMTPQFWAYYDYASGDPNPGTGDVHRTFHQLFPFGHYYFGLNDLVGRENINDFNCQFSLYPTKWVTLLAQFHVFRLDSPRDALYNSAGVATRRDPTGRSGSDVGDVLDGIINFHLDKHQDILLNYSHLFAGDFIRKTGPMGNPDYLYVQYSFRW